MFYSNEIHIKIPSINNLPYFIAIDEVGQHLQCESYWCGHYENLAIGDVPTGVQRWINEGPGGGHHDNMVSSDVAWVGCWHKGDCLKCLYWGK